MSTQDLLDKLHPFPEEFELYYGAPDGTRIPIEGFRREEKRQFVLPGEHSKRCLVFIRGSR